mmetsp:Transcript_31967/g.79064  ORF Transcript_31967/g.79064 Transcript_31967/m.79064 type:complete len:334 (-) Transcript_31967:181-1182(-)
MQCASSSISCPATIFASRMSSCTVLMVSTSPEDFSATPPAADVASTLACFRKSACDCVNELNFTSSSGGSSDPRGSHCREFEYTISLMSAPRVPLAVVSRTHLTCILNTMVLRSLGASDSLRYSNSRGSARMGTKPRRCANTSSCTMHVLLTMNTFSMAMVGTSAMRMRRKALAMAGLMPCISNSTLSTSSAVTSRRKASRNPSMVNVLSIPTELYAPLYAYSVVCLFSSAAQVTNLRCRSSSALTSLMSGRYLLVPAGAAAPASAPAAALAPAASSAPPLAPAFFPMLDAAAAAAAAAVCCGKLLLLLHEWAQMQQLLCTTPPPPPLLQMGA